MDDYILQILKANSVAKDQVKDTLDSHADGLEAIKEMKQKIDQELETYLATETESILNETDSYRASMKPKYDQEYQERVSNLVDRFNGAKSEWYSKLFERITLPDGK